MIKSLLSYVFFIILIVYMALTPIGQTAIQTIGSEVNNFYTGFVSYIPLQYQGLFALLLFMIFYLIIKNQR